MERYKKIEFTKNEINYLRNIDKNMKMLIDTVGEVHREYIPDPFIALINSIIFQQITYKAAASIWNRFEKTITSITPENILNTDFEILRQCGLSKTKIQYINNISEAVISGKLKFEDFQAMNDEEIISKLVEIKGIGEWTAEMFLIFSLNKKNVLSYKDLGIRRGIKWLYKMPNEPTKEEFCMFKEKYSPYNTLASFYLWEITIRNYFKYQDVEQFNDIIVKE